MKWMVDFFRNSDTHCDKIDRVTQFSTTNPSIYFNLYGVGVRSDRGRFSIHSPFMKNSIIIFMTMTRGRQCKAERESDIDSISPKTRAPQYQPIDRKKRNRKIVEDYSKDRVA